MKTTKQILIILLINLIYPAFGQKIDSIKVILSHRSFNQLDSFLTKINSDENHIFYKKGRNRQIIDSFSEITIKYEEWIADDSLNESFSSCEYLIHIITYSDSIIFLKVYDYINNIQLKTEDTLFYIDTIFIEKLTSLYQKTYGRQISVADLFSEDVIYGETLYRFGFNEYIKSCNIEAIDKMLCSPTTELQIFAIDALFQLKKNGYKPTDTELKLIELIKSKKGQIMYLNSASCNLVDISKITNEFEFK